MHLVQKRVPEFFDVVLHLPPASNMALLPAHQPLLEDDTDEELTDEQVRQLLTEASERIRAKSSPPTTTHVPFKLPKLNPGHVADTYSTTQGAITKLDSSKLLGKKELVLANGVKKIEDPVQLKKQKAEVCSDDFLCHADDDNYPILH